MGPGPDGPRLYAASNAGDLSMFLPFLAPEHRSLAMSVNFSSHVLLAAFRGVVGSSGFGITLRRLAIQNGQWRAVVALQNPSPDAFGRPALNSPYHLVQVPRNTLGGPLPSSWIMLDEQGRTLAAKQPQQQ